EQAEGQRKQGLRPTLMPRDDERAAVLTRLNGLDRRGPQLIRRQFLLGRAVAVLALDGALQPHRDAAFLELEERVVTALHAVAVHLSLEQPQLEGGPPSTGVDCSLTG